MLQSQPANVIQTKPYVFLNLLSKKKSNTKPNFSITSTTELQPTHFGVIGARRHYRTRTPILSTEVISLMSDRHLALNLRHGGYVQDCHLII
jgi:hypothetical protein